MEVNTKEARAKISVLLDKIERGEEVTIVRRGKKVARLIPIESVERRLPDLSAFRNSISVKGDPLSKTVIQEREKERYQ